MLIKAADDKTKEVKILQRLLNHPAATAGIKRAIEQEIRNIRSGAENEKQTAYEINFDYEPSKNWAVIHELRIEHGGRVAQIDHVLVNRFLDVWVCESKYFAEGIAINEHGECSFFSGGKPHGAPSPFEQNRRHCAVLKAVFDDGAVELHKRLGFSIKPRIKSLILVSKNARITRPQARIKGLDDIMKVDQVRAHIDRAIDDDNNVLSVAKVIGSGTLKDFANRLAALHTPIAWNWHAQFGLPREIARPVAIGASEAAPGGNKPKPMLACHSCKAVVTDKNVAYCEANRARFGGRVYCIPCQRTV